MKAFWVWLLYGAVAAWTVFACLLSELIPFDNRPVSFIEHLRKLGLEQWLVFDRWREIAAWAVVLCAAGAILCVWAQRAKRSWQRIAACLVGFAVPFAVFGKVAILALAYGPFLMANMLFGTVDGEFFADGDVLFVAAGWWLAFWLLMLGVSAVECIPGVRELVGRVREHGLQSKPNVASPTD